MKLIGVKRKKNQGHFSLGLRYSIVWFPDMWSLAQTLCVTLHGNPAAEASAAKWSVRG
jgi:hypothetical protein